MFFLKCVLQKCLIEQIYKMDVFQEDCGWEIVKSVELTIEKYKSPKEFMNFIVGDQFFGQLEEIISVSEKFLLFNTCVKIGFRNVK